MDNKVQTERETEDELLQAISESQDLEDETASHTGDDHDQEDLHMITNMVGETNGTDVECEGVIENSTQGAEIKKRIQEPNHESVIQMSSSCPDQSGQNKIKYDREIAKKEIEMKNQLESFKKKIEQLENEKERLKDEIKIIMKKQDVVEINESGKKVIIPTVNHDLDKLDEEILNDTREAELLIQLKHLSERVEAQDTLLAETKEDNTVLRIQNQSLLETINKTNQSKYKTKKKKKDIPSLDWLDTDDSNEKKRLFLLEQELEDQKEVNKQLKAYVGDILINIIVQNPQILEKKQ
eukprot:GFUD01063298.1.p1 GENE.GFUD01063298.1~~GFUD01063298.1.p1  ORF type:complete len:325 (-),score=112.24 GFUD01063298.1:325-1212(-)